MRDSIFKRVRLEGGGNMNFCGSTRELPGLELLGEGGRERR